MNKHWIVFLAVSAALLAAMTGCGSSGTADSAETTAVTEATTEQKTEAETESAKQDDTKKVASADKADSDKSDDEEFWCMGKNDTCQNKTSSAYDLYCNACDPDDNNIEGDQSGDRTDGAVGDNDYDGDVDNDDWEDE